MRNVVMIGALILTACGERQLTNDDFKIALDREFETSGRVCVPLDKAFPAALNEMEQEHGVGRMFAALEGAGLLSSKPTDVGRRYEVTEAGRQFYSEREGQSVGLTVRKVTHGFMCFADLRVENVKRWKALDDQRFAVTYTYRLEDVASWAAEPSVLKVMPKLAMWMNGAERDVRKSVVKKSDSGLEAVVDTSR